MTSLARPARTRRSRHPAIVSVRPVASLRQEHLRHGLVSTVDALQKRRADLLADGDIADYVALDWLEWNGGTLRLTQTGKNIFRQMQVGVG